MLRLAMPTIHCVKSTELDDKEHEEVFWLEAQALHDCVEERAGLEVVAQTKLRRVASP